MEIYILQKIWEMDTMDTMDTMDVVVLWVDGDDPHHKEKREFWMSNLGVNNTLASTNAYNKTRFLDHGEIYYLIASILKYLPNFRKLHIVTDGQTPKKLEEFFESGLLERLRVNIVDHKEIFEGYETFLPTFNSLTLETMLWKIKGLSDNFLYFNDDMFINKPLTIGDLITDQGKVVVYGKRRSCLPLNVNYKLRNFKNIILGKKNVGSHFKTAQVKASNIARRPSYIQVGHTGHLLKKHIFEDFFEKNQKLLENQIQHKFRSIDQFLPVGLHNSLLDRVDNIEIVPLDESAYFKPNNMSEEKLKSLFENNATYGCIQSLEEFNDSDHKSLIDNLQNKFKEYLPKIN